MTLIKFHHCHNISMVCIIYLIHFETSRHSRVKLRKNKATLWSLTLNIQRLHFKPLETTFT